MDGSVELASGMREETEMHVTIERFTYIVLGACHPGWKAAWKRLAAAGPTPRTQGMRRMVLLNMTLWLLFKMLARKTHNYFVFVCVLLTQRAWGQFPTVGNRP